MLALAVVAAGASRVGALSPSASVTTAIQGWERWLDVQWTAEAKAKGQVIDGYVYNKYGSPLESVQILAQGLDGSGAVVDQKLEWIPGSVPALQRAYFRIPPMRQAARYRVSVWAFNIAENTGAFP